ncbi:uncharacterized protein SOCE26_028270 [Sorangium cellulosum]|uniref:Secreted protein n=1 Tax=Sorangium cellulosum TaxID=56 RepID=A0A2L0EQ64_SORCE|nr:MXAN_6577-like cysteine-rich protein [Sorangium cellulosum]AUX41415.1 uncharacterized protein SOCE26_028270 [Sorangium cellulosum]
MEKLSSRIRIAPSYTLLWLAAAALVAPACSDGGTTTPACEAPRTQCDGVCVDASTDPSHCGTCGTTCASGETCSAGVCAPGCDDGQTSCGGECVDLETEEANCGSCGAACEDGETCVAGECQAAGCPEGQAECDGGCVDTASDPANCGECGSACDEGQTCEAGACQNGECSEGLTNCDRACVDTAVDEQHCGGCGEPCAEGQTCEAGECEDGCGSGLTACGEACVDVQTSSAHCGGCDEACGAMQVCQAGACACTVSPGQDLGRTVPQFVNSSTIGAPSTYSPSCVATSANERIFSFTAATAGVYSFDTSRSGYNTVVALLDAAGCSELACNADPGAARVTQDLGAGQTVYIVVDGADGETGAFELEITRASAPSCPAGELTSTVPQTITGNTAGRPNSVRPTVTADCPLSSTASDAGYTFTAPVAGDYVFDTFGSSFNTVLHIHDATCGGPQLACNDDTTVEQSEVTVTLAAGQTVVAVVDGSDTRSGAFTLNVRRAVPPPTCDGSGACGDDRSGCLGCALVGNCEDELGACGDSEACVDFIDCYVVCGTDACRQDCATRNPAGAALYRELTTCMYCEECPIDCAGVGATCP